MINKLIWITVLITFLTSLFGIIPVEASSWWNSSWSYRKQHNITGSSAGNQTDYQMSIIVINGTGTDSGATVYIDNKGRSDFGDIRFTWYNSTSGEEQECDYWIEKNYTGYNATFWVEIPFISNVTDNMIYIYYGNSDATTTSNGDNTFVFYDDFDDQTWSDKWTKKEGGGDWLITYPSHDDGYALKIQKDDGCCSEDLRRNISSNLSTDRLTFYWEFAGNATRRSYIRADTIFELLNDTESLGTIHYGVWNTYSCTNDTDTCCFIYGNEMDWTNFERRLDEVIDNDCSMSFGSEDVTIVQIRLRAWSDCSGCLGSIEWWDNWKITKYVSPEPSHGDWGSEETDETPPKYSDNSISSTIAGSAVEFRLRWTDNAGLSGYKFYFGNGSYPPRWWDTDWNYRKSHDITGSNAGDQTNYQMNITIISVTGTDSGATVYIDKVRSDFGDIRFTWYNSTSEKEQECDYWIEENYTGDNATFWVEIPFISNATDNMIYIYYGNSDATTKSNGTNTFNHFQSFETGFAPWTNLSYDGCDNVVIIDTIWAKYGNYSANIKLPGCGSGWGGWAKINLSNFNIPISGAEIRFNYAVDRPSIAGCGDDESYLRVKIDENIEWEKNSCNYPNGNPTQDYFDTVNLSSYGGQNVHITFINEFKQCGGGWWGTCRWWVDPIVIRNLASPEPSHGTWGSEEEYLTADDWVAFTPDMCPSPYTECWSNVTKVVNSTIGATIKWRVYANDTNNNWNTSSIYSFVTTAPPKGVSVHGTSLDYYTGEKIDGKVTVIPVEDPANKATVNFNNGQWLISFDMITEDVQYITFITDGNEKIGYTQLKLQNANPRKISTCSMQDISLSGYGVDVNTGNQINSGNVRVSIVDTDYTNITSFAGNWGIDLHPCLISGKVYTLHILISDNSGRTGEMFESYPAR